MPGESYNNRRQEDRRLSALESSIERNTAEIGRIRTSLGDRFTTLMFELDNRYMPRGELEVIYIPRREHETRQAQAKTWRLQWPIVIYGAIQTIINIILILHATH